MSPNLMCPHDDDSTRSVCLMKRVVLTFQDPLWLNLSNDSYHTEVLHNI